VSDSLIYHIALQSEIGPEILGGAYTPARFSDDGFVHCAAGRDTVIAVAVDYYATVAEPVLLLAIDTDRLAVPWRLEPPAPIEGGGTAHLDTATEFPHIYGAVNLEAIVGIGRLGPGDGSFAWPSRFAPVETFLRTRSD
jgi:uncharacterized protein (DUF952 family)